MWKNGAPVADPPPVPARNEFFVMKGHRFQLQKLTRYLGFVCEWSAPEWDLRHRWRSRVDPRRILAEFTLGTRHYVLMRHCSLAYPHLLRRYAEILGGKLAEPESPGLQTAVAGRIRDFQSSPALLGGVRRFRDFYWITSGKRIGGHLPLAGMQSDNAMSLATPAMVNGKLCSVQLANQYLAEFPAGSAVR